jgi:hypothetical protein
MVKATTEEILEAIRTYASSMVRTQSRSPAKRKAEGEKVIKEVGEQVYALMHLQATGWLPMRKRRRSREDHDAEG